MEPLFIAFGLLGATAAIGALGYQYFFSKTARTKRAIKRQEQVPIGEASEGVPIRIVGSLSYAGQPLDAPLTGRPCAAWHVLVEEYKGSGGARRGNWATVVEDWDSRPFIVEDGTGKAFVKAEAADLALVQDAHFRSGTFDDAHERLEAFLNDHGEASTGAVFNRTLRYREGVLAAGETVAVMGIGRLEMDPDGDQAGAGYRTAPQRLVVDGLEDGRLLVSDDPKTTR